MEDIQETKLEEPIKIKKTSDDVPGEKEEALPSNTSMILTLLDSTFTLLDTIAQQSQVIRENFRRNVSR